MSLRTELLQLCADYQAGCQRNPTVLILDEQTFILLQEEMNTKLVVNNPNSIHIGEFRLEVILNTLADKVDFRVLS